MGIASFLVEVGPLGMITNIMVLDSGYSCSIIYHLPKYASHDVGDSSGLQIAGAFPASDSLLQEYEVSAPTQVSLAKGLILQADCCTGLHADAKASVSDLLKMRWPTYCRRRRPVFFQCLQAPKPTRSIGYRENVEVTSWPCLADLPAVPVSALDPNSMSTNGLLGFLRCVGPLF